MGVRFGSAIDLSQLAAAPANADAGTLSLYGLTDGNIYSKDPSGVIQQLTNVPSASARLVGETINYAVPGAVPAGWLECDGTVLDQTAYPALAAAIQGTYNRSTDAGYPTVCRLPDVRRRILRGASVTNPLGSNDAIEATETGRNLNHTHTIPSVANHQHNASGLSTDGTSLNQQSNTTATGAALRLVQPDTHSHNVVGTTGLAGNHDHGGTDAFSLPFVVLRVLICAIAVGIATANSQQTIIAGPWYESQLGTGATLALPNNKYFAVPFTVPRKLQLVNVGLYVTAATTSGGLIRCGLFNSDASGAPSTVIHDFGTVASDSIGFKTFNSGDTVLPGVQYWIGMKIQVVSNPNVRIRQSVGTNFPIPVALMAATAVVNSYSCLSVTEAAATGPLTSPMPAMSAVDQTACLYYKYAEAA